MLLVPCPNCGPRNQSDLRLVGESISRPDPNTASREEWGAYLYLRENVADWQTETWYCRAGCRTYFKAERNTATNEFRNPPMPGDKVGSGTYITPSVGQPQGEQS
ncbi:MAG: sarcosine oxidase subunit delta [Acidimicrobiales bacterium]|nr:MAG: sarcosine oxidase subunit delta [Acidimicrobiales bacterium]